MKPITFGTDGWRGIMSDDFTYANIACVTEAIASYLRNHGHAGAPVVVGYDTRFNSDNFAAFVAYLLANEGIKPLLAASFIPTPVTAFAVSHLKTAGAIMFTASHNPPIYNGIKYIPEYAGPALPDVTNEITENISDLMKKGYTAPALPHDWPACERFDVKSAYLAQLSRLIDGKAIADAGFPVVYNPLFATGQGYLDEFLRMHGCAPKVINNWRDTLFGGWMPDPSLDIIGKTTPNLAGIPVLVATDGDADRAAVVENGAKYFGGNENLAIIANYLLERRGMKGAVARTVATSHLPDRIAKGFGQEAVETDVGFKYIGEHLRGGALVGGEESGGISIQGHVPEKDGILTCLLMLEIRAKEGKTLAEYQAGIFERFGPVRDRRNDYHLDPAQKQALFDALGSVGGTFLGRKVAATNFNDGRKFIFEGGEWILLRPSGTEPVVRVYFECVSDDSLADLEKRATDFLNTSVGQP